MRNALYGFFTLCIAVCAASPSPAGADDKPKNNIPILRFAVGDSVKPLSYRDVDGSLAGALKNALERVESGGTLKFQIFGFPWKRAQTMVQTGAMDGFCAVATEERSHYALFADEPLLLIDEAIYFRKEDGAAANIRSVDDFAKFRQGDYIGNGWTERLFGRDNITWVKTREDALKMIAGNRLDVMVGDLLEAQEYLSALGLQDQVTFQPARFLPSTSIQCAVRKNYPNAEAVAALLNLSIKNARKDPSYSEAVSPYR